MDETHGHNKIQNKHITTIELTFADQIKQTQLLGLKYLQVLSTLKEKYIFLQLKKKTKKKENPKISDSTKKKKHIINTMSHGTITLLLTQVN